MSVCPCSLSLFISLADFPKKCLYFYNLFQIWSNIYTLFFFPLNLFYAYYNSQMNEEFMNE